jgi:probable HAF family extracellular repeat protein
MRKLARFALISSPVLVIVCAATVLPALAQQYTVTDLGALGIPDYTWSINAHGQVAGYSYLGPDPHGNYHAEGFFHDGVSIDYIGTPGSATGSDLLGVNDLGEAVGKSWGDDGEALLRRVNGSIRQLGTLGGSRSYARAINHSSQVVGTSKLAGDAESRAFVWTDGTMEALPVLGGTQASAVWINGPGQIVGSSTTETGGLQQFGVIWDNGTVTQLPPIYPGKSNIASFIHDDGSIAGRVTVPGQNPSGFLNRAAIWRDGEVDLVLGTLADGTPEEPYASSSAQAVNASGDVVGMSVAAGGDLTAFVYFVRDSTMYRLDELIPGNWDAYWVGSGCLNDAGQIAVSAVALDGSSHALLLTPVATTALAGGTGDAREDHGYLATRGLRIAFGIPVSGRVTISVFDVSGRLLATPVDDTRSAGDHVVLWNGRTLSGNLAPSGVYFLRMSTPDFVASDRLVLVR